MLPRKRKKHVFPSSYTLGKDHPSGEKKSYEEVVDGGDLRNLAIENHEAGVFGHQMNVVDAC